MKKKKCYFAGKKSGSGRNKLGMFEEKVSEDKKKGGGTLKNFREEGRRKFKIFEENWRGR